MLTTTSLIDIILRTIGGVFYVAAFLSAVGAFVYILREIIKEKKEEL